MAATMPAMPVAAPGTVGDAIGEDEWARVLDDLMMADDADDEAALNAALGLPTMASMTTMTTTGGNPTAPASAWLGPLAAYQGTGTPQSTVTTSTEEAKSEDEDDLLFLPDTVISASAERGPLNYDHFYPANHHASKPIPLAPATTATTATTGTTGTKRRTSPPSAKALASAGMRMPVPPAKYLADYIDLSKVSGVVLPPDVRARNDAALLEFQTEFKKKYYRLDNKVLQCFPSCSRFPDVREAKMLGIEHTTESRRAASWCSNDVFLLMSVDPALLPHLHVRGRFIMATPDASPMPGDWAFLAQGDVVASPPESMHTRLGSVSSPMLSADGHSPALDARGRVCVTVAVPSGNPLGWVHDMELPRYRRAVGAGKNTVPLFVFETSVFVRDVSTGSYRLLARAVSPMFEISSVRTLLREALAYRNAVAGISSSSSLSSSSQAAATAAAATAMAMASADNMSTPSSPATTVSVASVGGAGPNKKAKTSRKFLRHAANPDAVSVSAVAVAVPVAASVAEVSGDNAEAPPSRRTSATNPARRASASSKSASDAASGLVDMLTRAFRFVMRLGS